MEDRTALLRPIVAATAVAASVALASCGGGGGGASPAPSPTPAPAPAPPPPSISSVDATKVSLTQLPASCSTSAGCLAHRTIEVDPTGEVTVFWSELPPGGVSRLSVASIARNANAPLSTGTVESNFASPIRRDFIVRRVANRRFVLMHQYGSGPSNLTVARVVSMAAGGSATVEPAVVLPPAIQSPGGFFSVVQDSMRQLYVYGNVTAPYPTVALGGGVTLNTVRPLGFTYLASAEAGLDADFDESAAPRSLRVLRGREMPTDPVGMYVSDMDLIVGTILPPIKVSTQPIVIANAQGGCASDPPMQASASVGPMGATYLVAWRQLNASGTACELFVNGQRVNTGTVGVSMFTVSGRNGDVIAVWSELETVPPGRQWIYWSRRDPVSTTWSAPQPIPTPLVPDASQRMDMGASGPGGALVVAWTSFAPGGGNLLSKYVGGTWTTVRAPMLVDVRGLAINASGQAAALYRSTVCGLSSCEELAAYQF